MRPAAKSLRSTHSGVNTAGATDRRGDGKRDDLLRNCVENELRFTGAPCENGKTDNRTLPEDTPRDAAEMVKLRVHEARKEQYRSGDALDWSVLDFRTRRRCDGSVSRAGT